MIIKFDGSIYEKWTAWEFIKVTQNFVNMNSLFSHTVREEGYWGKEEVLPTGGGGNTKKFKTKMIWSSDLKIKIIKYSD